MDIFKPKSREEILKDMTLEKYLMVYFFKDAKNNPVGSIVKGVKKPLIIKAYEKYEDYAIDIYYENEHLVLQLDFTYFDVRVIEYSDRRDKLTVDFWTTSKRDYGIQVNSLQMLSYYIKKFQSFIDSTY